MTQSNVARRLESGLELQLKVRSELRRLISFFFQFQNLATTKNSSGLLQTQTHVRRLQSKLKLQLKVSSEHQRLKD